MTDAGEQERRERERRQREEELRRIPPQEIDPSKWPRDVRTISLNETGGLGIDRTGRLYWNGRPVDVTGQRLDLTWPQVWAAIAVDRIHLFRCCRSDLSGRDRL